MDKPRTTGRNRRNDTYGDRLKRRRASLSPSLLTVADYINGHRHAVLGKSALDIGRETGTSDATVIRAIQMLGFDGLLDLKDTLEAYIGQTDSPTEKMATTTSELVSDVDTAINFVIEDQANAMEALALPENRANMATAISLLSRARSIGVMGIGASGIIASYASRLFLRIGYPSYVLDRTGIMLAEQMLDMGSGDVMLALMQGRAHREATAMLAEAERLSIPVIMVVGKADSVLLKQAAAHIVIPRAKGEHVALHASTLFCVEAMMLALASTDRERTLSTMDRLLEIRQQIRPNKR